MSRIYVASSWSNPYYQDFVSQLRDRGHKVYDFRHPFGRDDRSVWDDIGVTGRLHDGGLDGNELECVLNLPAAHDRFKEHFNAMLDADTCVLFLPSGRSSHVEAGFMSGMGKRVFAFGSDYRTLKPELMYLVFDAFFSRSEDLFKALNTPLAGICRVCGCSLENPCYHPDNGFCHWVAPSLCSHCASVKEGGYGIKDNPETHHCINDLSPAYQ